MPSIPVPRDALRVRSLNAQLATLSLPRPLFLTISVAVLLLLAPAFLLFEIWQLCIGDRCLGIKHSACGADLRERGLGEVTAFF